MTGPYPQQYERATHIDKPLGTILSEFDRMTCELLPGDAPSWLDSTVLLPPLVHEGIRTRGILVTMAAEYLIDRHPDLQQMFHVVASAQWCNFPWSRRADALCALYANPRRNAWFRQTYPQRRQLLLPIQEADLTNERLFAPDGRPKTGDLLCVSRQASMKNLPMLALALASYNRRHGPLRMTLVAGFNTDPSHPEGEPAFVLQEMREAVPDLDRFMELVPFRSSAEMPALYNAHRLLVFGALIEGKNRALHEAMCCDVPIVCCEAFNRYTRGNAPIFPDGAGVLAPFDPDGFADAIHDALERLEELTPRRSYLGGFSGRHATLDLCLRTLPEYAELIERFEHAGPSDNAWLHAALGDRYGCDLMTFLFEENQCTHAIGLEHHDAMLDFYRGLLGRRLATERSA